MYGNGNMYEKGKAPLTLPPSPATNACYTQAAATTTSLTSEREPEVVTVVVST